MAEYYYADVISNTRLSPSMIRIEFGGDDLVHFRSSGRPDEWIRLLFPATDGEPLILPALIDGKWQRPAGPTRPYTVRKWDETLNRLVVDFVCHDGGVAAHWAQSAVAGDRIGISHAEGRFAAPEDCQWILLFADFTGLPAVGRILEEQPAGRRIFAHLEVPLKSDRQNLHSQADISINWYEGYGQGDQPTRLLDIIHSTKLPEGNGYIWIAGEVKAASDSRKYLRDILGFNKERITSVGYWIEGQARG